MKLLDPEFKKRGFSYKLVKKNSVAFLYEIRDEGLVRGYEVWRRKVSEPVTVTMGGVSVDFEEAERFPGNNDFGTWAWAYMTMPFAQKRFDAIV
jgi:hypothetical protein